MIFNLDNKKTTTFSLADPKADLTSAEIQAVADDIIAQKNELAKDFDQNLLFKFERIIRNKGGIGIVPIHGIVSVHPVCPEYSQS